MHLIDPMDFIGASADTAPYWYVRNGTRDRDTAFTVSINPDRALTADRQVKDVNFRLAWNQPHAGNYDVPEARSWIATVVSKSSDPLPVPSAADEPGLSTAGSATVASSFAAATVVAAAAVTGLLTLLMIRRSRRRPPNAGVHRAGRLVGDGHRRGGRPHRRHPGRRLRRPGGERLERVLTLRSRPGSRSISAPCLSGDGQVSAEVLTCPPSLTRVSDASKC
ncbi:hypothetical protein GCM10010112_89490 [Actinoplanes lobatus]|uniref:Uncharacterized protein n=1 Tax=Actinoplanes lobatus TaxID=113568 RepID=A0ABQ4AXD2_9ACTN|nr:hypothetical protein GCM10010112_89490 [Actinoplanes lobatus]GIE45670.1 hypothetical protein Alo02nite_85680 [Actinoplanes lobatus]